MDFQEAMNVMDEGYLIARSVWPDHWSVYGKSEGFTIATETGDLTPADVMADDWVALARLH